MDHINATLAYAARAALFATCLALPLNAIGLDAIELTEQCAAQDWSRYMQCQRILLEVRARGEYCVPEPENAARYQIEFVAFMGAAGAGALNEPAYDVAARYFADRYRCE